MQTDTIKLISSHIVAVVTCLGGLVLLVFIAMQPDFDGKAGLMTLVGGFIGLSFQFLYQTNTTAAARGQTRTDILTPTPDQPA